MKVTKTKTNTAVSQKMSFVSGDDAERLMEERTLKREQEAEERRKNLMPRFWLQVGASAKLLFISPKPVLVNEHNIKLNGYWGNYFLCRKTIDQCPLCEAGHRDYDALLYTVVNLTGYVSQKTGKRMKNLKQVLALKATAAAKFKRKKKELDTIKFAIFEFTRDTKDDPSTGGDISFVKQLELKEVVAMFRKEGLKDAEIKELLQPYNLEERYTLKSIQELEEIAGTKTVGREDFTDDELPLDDDEPAKPKTRMTEVEASGDDDDKESSKEELDDETLLAELSD